MEKDRSIVDLLDWLRETLGDAFVVTDHWEADLCAVGISAPRDPARLVYILTWGRPQGHYAVELETAPLPDSQEPYENVGKFDLVSRDELLRIVRKHLRISD
jgi:hypothetical protein